MKRQKKSSESLPPNLSISETIEANVEPRELEKDVGATNAMLPKRPSEVKRIHSITDSNTPSASKPSLGVKPAFRISGKVDVSETATSRDTAIETIPPINPPGHFRSMNPPTQYSGGSTFKPQEIDLQHSKPSSPSGHNSLQTLRGHQPPKKIEPPAAFGGKGPVGGGAGAAPIRKPGVSISNNPILGSAKPNVAKKPSFINNNNANASSIGKPSISQKPNIFSKSFGNGNVGTKTIRGPHSSSSESNSSTPAWTQPKLKNSTPNKGTVIPELKGGNVKRFQQQERHKKFVSPKPEWVKNQSRWNSSICSSTSSSSCCSEGGDSSATCSNSSCLSSWSAA